MPPGAPSGISACVSQPITVTNAPEGSLNGTYQFDAVTDAWVNQNNVQWSIQKVWWDANALGTGNAAGNYWTVVFDPDAGVAPPPGAIPIGKLWYPTLIDDPFPGSTAQNNGWSFINDKHANRWPFYPNHKVLVERFDASNPPQFIDSVEIAGDIENDGEWADTVLGSPPSMAEIFRAAMWEFGSPKCYSLTATIPQFNPHGSVFLPSYQTSAAVGSINPVGSSNVMLGGWNSSNAGACTAQSLNDLWGNSANSYDNGGVKMDYTRTWNDGTTYNFKLTLQEPFNLHTNRPFNYLMFGDTNDVVVMNKVATAFPYPGGKWSAPFMYIASALEASVAWDFSIGPLANSPCPPSEGWFGVGNIPGVPSNISAVTTPGVPSNISAVTTPGVPSNISASLDVGGVPGVPSNISASVLQIPGAPSSVSASLAVTVPEAPSSISANLVTIPGNPSSISASLVAGAVPGNPSSISATVVERSYTGRTRPPKYMGFAYSEMNQELAGPFSHENLTALTSIQNQSNLLCVTEEQEIKKTDLRNYRDRDFPVPPSLWGDLLTQPSGDDFVVGNPDGAFMYRGRHISSPFADPVMGVNTITNPYFFTDAYLAVTETAWMHLGNEHNNKQIHRIDYNFSKNSFGHLWAYVQSDSEKGKISGQYKGLIKENMRVFTNIRGRRFRVKTFIVSHKDHPWNLREMAVGHLVGKSF